MATDHLHAALQNATPRTPPRLKICCIGSADEARAAVAAGAHALGLVSAMPSGPGVIPEALIAEIAAAVPAPVETFLLTCLRTPQAIAEQHARCRTTTLQLVDTLPVAALEELRARLPGVALVQVIHVQGPQALQQAVSVAPLVDTLLLDSGNPGAPVQELGGTGRVHDWSVSARIVTAVDKPVYLAGGLHAGNVAAALAAVQPAGLDICSGVREGGRLSPARLQALVQALHHAG